MRRNHILRECLCLESSECGSIGTEWQRARARSIAHVQVFYTGTTFDNKFIIYQKTNAANVHKRTIHGISDTPHGQNKSHTKSPIEPPTHNKSLGIKYNSMLTNFCCFYICSFHLVRPAPAHARAPPLLLLLCASCEFIVQ